jgi:hypothetical protein
MNATRLNTQLLLQRSVEFNQNLSPKFLTLTRWREGGNKLDPRELAHPSSLFLGGLLASLITYNPGARSARELVFWPASFADAR